MIQFIASMFVGIAMFIEHHVVCNKDILFAMITLFLTQLIPLLTHPDGFVGGLWVHF